jgi:plasmid stabilization system protein ParE
VKLVWSPIALRHLREARDFIAQDNPEAADRLVALIDERAATLALFPGAGRAEPAGRRALALPPTPFRLIYRTLPDRILILAVWHGARAWPPARG